MSRLVRQCRGLHRWCRIWRWKGERRLGFERFDGGVMGRRRLDGGLCRLEMICRILA